MKPTPVVAKMKIFRSAAPASREQLTDLAQKSGVRMSAIPGTGSFDPFRTFALAYEIELVQRQDFSIALVQLPKSGCFATSPLSQTVSWKISGGRCVCVLRRLLV
jgi:hypothetical protein